MELVLSTFILANQNLTANVSGCSCAVYGAFVSKNTSAELTLFQASPVISSQALTLGISMLDKGSMLRSSTKGLEVRQEKILHYRAPFKEAPGKAIRRVLVSDGSIELD